jgi:hypothetical protein
VQHSKLAPAWSGRGHQATMPSNAYVSYPSRANSRPEQVQQTEQAYSITASARADRPGGTSMPSALAVLMLITNSNLIDCWTGRSAG